MTNALTTPLSKEKVKNLRAGDFFLISGKIIGARDAAHKKILKSIADKENLPLDFSNQVIFYVGPSPTAPGKISGSIGPTTSARMDNMTEPLLKIGVRATIGKGARSDKIKKLCKIYKSVYFITPGGIAAYLAKRVKKLKVAAYKDLGPEALFEIEVRNFPVFVAYDIYGGDIFSTK